MGMSPQQVIQNDPEYLRQQLAQQEIAKFSTPGSAAGAIGALLGRGVSNVASGRGFFSVADPALQKVATLQGIYNNVIQEVGADNPGEAFNRLAKEFAAAGFGQEAMAAAQEAAKFRPSAGKPLTPSDTFAQVGLSLGISPRSDLSQYTPEEAKRISDEIQKQKEGVSRAGAPQPTAQDKALLPGVAKTRETILTSALSAQTTKNTADRIGQIVDSAFTGVGSGAKLTVGQLASAFGADVRGTTETEQLDSLLAQLAQGQARSLPGALSDKDLAFLREAIGKRTLTVGTLKSLANRIKEDAIIAEFENEGVQNVINSNGDLNRFDFVKNKRQAQQRAKAALVQEQQEQERLRQLRAKRGL